MQLEGGAPPSSPCRARSQTTRPVIGWRRDRASATASCTGHAQRSGVDVGATAKSLAVLNAPRMLTLRRGRAVTTCRVLRDTVARLPPPALIFVYPAHECALVTLLGAASALGWTSSDTIPARPYNVVTGGPGVQEERAESDCCQRWSFDGHDGVVGRSAAAGGPRGTGGAGAYVRGLVGCSALRGRSACCRGRGL